MLGVWGAGQGQSATHMACAGTVKVIDGMAELRLGTCGRSQPLLGEYEPPIIYGVYARHIFCCSK